MDTWNSMGMGGTDFRPAFLHVDQMIKAGKFSRLRGLLYFTDGYGTFPVKMPPYDTASCLCGIIILTRTFRPGR